ncbi:MAG: hypothetical protein ACOH1N_08110 [Lutibacter sp.]
MKKLLTICLLLTIAFTSQAQDGKPTKEETVEFIKNYLQNEKIECSDFSNNAYTTWRIQNLSFDFDESKNSITIYYEFHYNYRNAIENLTDNTIYAYKFIFDISKIESIGYGINDLSKKCNHIFLNFKGAADESFDYFNSVGYNRTENLPSFSSKIKELTIPISNSCVDCEFTTDEKKILQAFNHLRKLCGAPDPISFD